ncbi:hypothetical protein PsYK624_077230 [Phanerochaete sordida]|uniref:F-box domain-containing protein n=1 Tax=Phanerochaete sordida TaxID=48140 RepID=A0A9P3LEJ2_9APHY|nr:hypothetical protein PsYK624_077230 [Phanerochaete sordida]
MHPCLLIDEILGHVATFCSGDELAVARLGQVCRAFYEPAMDVLWAETPLVLEKLLLCLPADAVNTARLYSRAKGSRMPHPLCCGIKRAILPFEWDRFVHHTRRVKSLNLSVPPATHTWTVAGGSEGAQTYLTALRARFEEGPVFPNLQELLMSDFFAPWMGLFLHRGLISFHISDCNYTDLPQVLVSLAPCAPCLRTVSTELWGPSGDSAVSNAHESLLVHCANLTSFRTNCSVTPSTLLVLSTASHLKTLYLYSPLLLSLLSPHPSWKPMSFTSLECLQLSSSTQCLTHLLLVASFPAIRSIQLDLNVDLPETEIAWPSISLPQIHIMMNALARFSSLEEISIQLSPSVQSSDALSGDTLLALLPLQNLTNVFICIRRICLRSDHIAKMAAAWPKLQSLLLGPQDPWTDGRSPQTPTSICIEDLYPFAQGCPSLRTLAVTISGNMAPLIPFICDDTTVVQWSLQELRLQESFLQPGWECVRVANFLSAVFPRAYNQFSMHSRGRRDEIHAVLAEDAALTDAIDFRAGVLCTP